jgi:hypothetical protein
MLVPAARPSLDACGDKFLLVGRVTRFQLAYAAVYPGRILIYAHARTPETAAIRDPQLRKHLKQAGHQVAVVGDRDRLHQALASNDFDIVVADVADAPSLDRNAAVSPSKPTVLYVACQLDKAQLATLQTKYNCPLKANDKPNRYLTVIDDQMKARIDAGRRNQKSK